MGRLAVQPALRSGAHAIASASRPERAHHLTATPAADATSVERDLSVGVGRHGPWGDLEGAKAAQLDGSTTGKITLKVGQMPD